MVASSWLAGLDPGVVPDDRHVLGCRDSDAHLIALDCHQHDRDVFADGDGVIDAACENKHNSHP